MACIEILSAVIFACVLKLTLFLYKYLILLLFAIKG